MADDWELRPGQQIRRTELHEKYGGRRQGGISPSVQSPNVFIFTDPGSGTKHGYLDRWESRLLHCAGEGQRGNQEMKQGNKAILEHASQGRVLRVFEGAGGPVTYVGEFGLDPSEQWYWDTAPETGGGPLRKVIMFRLVPKGDFWHSGEKLNAEDLVPGLRTEYRFADEERVSKIRTPAGYDPDAVDRASRGHAATQNALAQWAADHGFTPLSPGIGDPPFDLGWWDDFVFIVVKVKSLTDTNETGQLRLGLGQVLDYEHVLRSHGKSVRPVLAVERKPSDSRWTDLCQRHGVKLVWPDTFTNQT